MHSTPQEHTLFLTTSPFELISLRAHYFPSIENNTSALFLLSYFSFLFVFLLFLISASHAIYYIIYFFSPQLLFYQFTQCIFFYILIYYFQNHLAYSFYKKFYFIILYLVLLSSHSFA